MESKPRDHHHTRNHAWEFYKRIGFIKSSRLNGAEVVFTDVGFYHLIYKGRKARSSAEQEDRLGLLQYASEILRDEHIEVEHRQKQNVQYWALRKVILGQRVKLVVRQIGEGRKHFYSIMSKRVKSKSP